MIAPNDEPKKPAKKQGGMGGVLTDKHRVRSDCQDIVTILRLGVFSESDIKRILKAAAPLATKCADAGKARDYAAVMRVITECAKIAQAERHKMLDKTDPDLHEHNLNVSGVVDLRRELLEDPALVKYLREKETTDP
jgi:hypothetical protein